MGDDSSRANEVYRLETDQPKTFGASLFFPVRLFWRPDWGHAGISIVRHADGKIVGIITDESYDSLTVKAQLEADIEAMTAEDFEQTWGVNTAR